jgi:hypothetical protein
MTHISDLGSKHAIGMGKKKIQQQKDDSSTGFGGTIVDLGDKHAKGMGHKPEEHAQEENSGATEEGA